MGKYLVPISMVGGMIGLATAALLIAFIPDHPTWWSAALSLAILGGIAPIIYGVNIRVVPVFGRRPWKHPNLLWLQVGFLLLGAWLRSIGLGERNDKLITVGSLLVLGSGILFMANIVNLFRQEPTTPSPPLPFPEQAAIDLIAIRFTRLSGLFLLTGLTIAATLSRWQPAEGRWDLVWAHTMLVGFVLSMASGTAYHVFSRWTGAPWKSVRSIRLHFQITVVFLPLMLIALATDWSLLFSIAGPLEAIALLLFLYNIKPMLLKMPFPSPPALVASSLFLLFGVFLGSWFAGHPEMGARFRWMHAEVNIFGWAGLLISGVAYYLVPRFAGRALVAPKAATVQIALLTGGVIAGATLLGLRSYGHGSDDWLIGSQISIALGFLLLAAVTAATFLLPRPNVAIEPIRVRPGASPRRPTIPIAKN